MKQPRMRSKEYHRLYKTARWLKMRRFYLRTHPCCERCEERNIIVASDVVHHLHPHKGDSNQFYFNKFQALCRPCHDGPIQQTECIGYDTSIGVDGWPIDQKHPVYRKA